MFFQGNNKLVNEHGNSTDRGNAIAIDKSGSLYIAGTTYSSDFLTLDPYQDTYQGGLGDAFVAKITFSPTCCDLLGDFDGSGGVDIAYLTATVNWMFKGGPAPICLNDADINATCAADISDLTYRADFMFNSGPVMVCGCVE